MSKYENLWKYISTQEENFLTLTFAQIEQIAGLPIDHSFLKYKAELLEYGWAVKKIHMKEQTVDFYRKAKQLPTNGLPAKNWKN